MIDLRPLSGGVFDLQQNTLKAILIVNHSLLNKKMSQNNYLSLTDRFISALYCGLGGIFLGITVAIFCSYQVSTSTSSVKIIIITTLLCALFGFLAPHLAKNSFRILWNFFSA